MTSSNMAALWKKLDSFEARRNDLESMEKDALPKRGTVSGELLDHTAQTLKIHENGNKAEEWLRYTRFIKDSVDFPDPVNRHNFLCGTYDQAIKMVPMAENKKNVAYAVMLIDYANLKSEYSPDDAQALFNYARVQMKRLAVVHIAAAQFELRKGCQSKCKKILEKARMFDVQPGSLLQKAMKNLSDGKSDLISEGEWEMYITSEVGKVQTSSTSSTESTGEWVLPQLSNRLPLTTLTNNVPEGHEAGSVLTDDRSKASRMDTSASYKLTKEDSHTDHNIPKVCEGHHPGSVLTDDRSKTSRMDTSASYKLTKEDSHTDHKSLLGSRDVTDGCGDVEMVEANTAPINMETDRHVTHKPPSAPASCSKPPFRSYHSTPDIKEIKLENKALSGHGKSAKYMPRRVRKLDIPVVTLEDEESDDEASFNDIKPLDPQSHDQSRSLASESMNQSHPGHTSGHTSGYVSSMSLTCHTRTCPIPTPSKENHLTQHRPSSFPGLKPEPSIKSRPSPLIEETPGALSAVNPGRVSTEQPSTGQSKLGIPASLPAPQPVGHPAAQPSRPASHPPPSIPHPSQASNQPMPSHPVFATPSNHGVHKKSQQAAPMMTPSMKAVQEITVNGRCYSILKVIGRGGSSKVYHCFDFENQQSVGIKQVNLSDADESIVQGYMNEITLLKRLQYSDKVIKMYDYEHNKQSESLLIVMELGDTDLASLFRNASKSKDITPSLMNYYWEAMLKAVKVLHREGIIHSDLKPANFLLVKGQLKLIDFGIANAIQQDRTSVMRDSQVGTLNYMSPEAIADSCGGMAMDGSGRAQPRYKIGVKSDVWSLGCILYNMVYGRTPFQLITNPLMKYSAIISPNYHIEFKTIPDKELLDVMKRCLVRDVKLRPSIDELLAHPYLKKTKEPAPAVPVPGTLLAKLQAVAQSPNSLRKLESVLEQLQGGTLPSGSGLT